MAVDTAPGFEIDPATGQPRVKKAATTVQRQPSVSGLPTSDDPLAALLPTSDSNASAGSQPATTGATFTQAGRPSEGGEPGPVDPTPPVPTPPVTPPTTPPVWTPNPPPPGLVPPKPGTPPPLGAPQDPTTLKAKYPTANAYLLSSLNDKTYPHTPQQLVAFVNQVYGLQSGSGAEYFAPGSHGQGSQEVIGLPGGYFAHENNDPNGAWHWVDNNEGGGGNSTTPTNLIDPAKLPQASTVNPELHQFILDLLKNGSAPVSADDPIIKGQLDAARVSGTRELATARNTAAERASAQGLPTAAFDNAVLGNQEKFGENMAGLTGQLLQSELTARRKQYTDALTFASGEDARSLQAQIANIDAQLRASGLNNQNQQFYDRLGFDYTSEEDAMNKFLQLLLSGR